MIFHHTFLLYFGTNVILWKGCFIKLQNSKGALYLPARRFSEPPRADGSEDDTRRARTADRAVFLSLHLHYI